MKKAKRRKKKKVVLHAKEPEEALAYLQSWETRQDGGSSTWKFNKATQAWLLRHAYDMARVPKDTFRLLLRYVDGLRGAARERLQADAGAVVENGGALPAAETATAAEEEAAEEPVEGQDKAKGRKRKKVEPDGPQKASGNADGSAADAAEAANGAEGTAADAAPPEISAAEAKAQRMRVRRANQLLAALGAADADAPDAEEEDADAGKRRRR
eukprot:TRINITY_DN16995_c0_g1_i1.p1 TRINITY_DN16995_c0_g1~~TRINITY_DN16995_c0_g1_i1.p1  ORF type:complete len:213 (-),score=75.26 TRINITY_DN16995_c0_g1_i1:60-698(-)